MFGFLQGIAGAIGAHGANKSLSHLQKLDPSYVANPLAAQYLNQVKQAYNGRMPGATQAENNIYTQNANFNDTVGKNATDGSQLIAAAAAGQGQTDQQLTDLSTKEAGYKTGLLDNLNSAYGQSVAEGDKVYGDTVRRYGDLVSIRGAQQKNKQNAINGVFNGLNSDINDFMTFASGGAFGSGGMFGKPAKTPQLI